MTRIPPFQVEIFLSVTVLVASVTGAATLAAALVAPAPAVIASALLAGAAGSWILSRGLGAAFLDQTRSLEERLEEATSEARRNSRLAAVGETVGALSCQLQDPLSRINGRVEALTGSDDGDVDELSWHIQGDVDRMFRLLAGMAELSRIRRPRREPVDVGALAREIAFQLPEAALVKVEVEVDPEAPRAWVDRQQVRSILTNLMRNGIEAMIPGGGTLRLRVAGEDGELKITIQDRGVGIPEALMQEVFEPLFTTNPESDGLGLGIARNLAENNGGEVSIQSRLGEGTSVTVQLPATAAVTHSEAPAAH